ncbi:hypothetical protein KAI87_12635, partial [Myxococcota bacterium]|nr:hypothetical protein [Myxococcota bacterium]
MKKALLTLAVVFCSPLLLAATPPGVSLSLSEKTLGELLTKVVPIQKEAQAAGGFAAFGPAPTVTVVMTEPTVRITNAVIKVTMKYTAKDASGVIDLSGVVKPDLVLVAMPGKKIVQARFTSLTLSLPGGMSLPLDGMMEPFDLPGAWPLAMVIEGKTINAEIVVTKVVTERGVVRLMGDMVYPKPA